jgi:hypothetical protein
MDGSSYHARAELRAMYRKERMRMLIGKKPLRVRVARWLKETIARLIAKGAR